MKSIALAGAATVLIVGLAAMMLQVVQVVRGRSWQALALLGRSLTKSVALPQIHGFALMGA